MEKVIYPAPVYTFLGTIDHLQRQADVPLEKKILDCAAGGANPPLGLFYEHGFETWGIDLSEEQVQRALAFGQEHGMALHIRLGDMRHLPFDDESFSYVYEYYSMCHLTKSDTGRAIREMRRVLRRGGLCFLGFMSSDCWPIMGREMSPGEYHLIEGSRPVIHSVYADDEPEAHLAGLEVVLKEKRTTWFRERMAQTSKEEWLEYYNEVESEYSEAEWARLYQEREARGNYTHLFYIVRKPT